MTPVRLEPAAPRSRVKHSTTEPLRSHTIHATIHGSIAQDLLSIMMIRLSFQQTPVS